MILPEASSFLQGSRPFPVVNGYGPIGRLKNYNRRAVPISSKVDSQGGHEVFSVNSSPPAGSENSRACRPNGPCRSARTPDIACRPAAPRGVGRQPTLFAGPTGGMSVDKALMRASAKSDRTELSQKC